MKLWHLLNEVGEVGEREGGGMANELPVRRTHVCIFGILLPRGGDFGGPVFLVFICLQGCFGRGVLEGCFGKSIFGWGTTFRPPYDADFVRPGNGPENRFSGGGPLSDPLTMLIF